MKSTAIWLGLGLSLTLAGVPLARAQQNPPPRLTLRGAIALALKQNLSVLVANTQVEELAGTRARRLASLLPHANANALANRENIDLGALGISFPRRSHSGRTLRPLRFPHISKPILD